MRARCGRDAQARYPAFLRRRPPWLGVRVEVGGGVGLKVGGKGRVEEGVGLGVGIDRSRVR